MAKGADYPTVEVSQLDSETSDKTSDLLCIEEIRTKHHLAETLATITLSLVAQFDWSAFILVSYG